MKYKWQFRPDKWKVQCPILSRAQNYNWMGSSHNEHDNEEKVKIGCKATKRTLVDITKIIGPRYIFRTYAVGKIERSLSGIERIQNIIPFD